MIKCSRCKQLLENNKFNWRIEGVKRAYCCKECSRDYIKSHYDKNKKDFSIGNLIMKGVPHDRLIAEMSKCKVRCANCHRRKTSKENNSWRLHYAPVA